ncbi:TPA: spore coat protein [Legionella pneumophila]|uniref:Putative sialic acid synthase n=1 Tax=Legionella pneumophila TaxID=446 RepID=E5BD82_LEGPN|nr:N-acetylneuraminate synthase family protein [Legionella pneumophila]MCK1862684.1 N-acetylneuraminate synthase family protein [Legionella pneumophila]MCZ4699478.1 N-acetylneuraminate synthase family protein [Legionella pneumophila]MCZ4730765.1 N-acetylneuraminate synthase family protein [Legionella pneumophila]MCZ4753449.1 N-acetylneuraminate synthase family protein [Legionella pneumophila]MDR9845639.1 N-acetylneuraminate synthase family protein [Legionella pneumophila]
MEREFKLGNFNVSTQSPPIFLAEVGSYFNGDYQLAKNMVESIIKASTMVPKQPVVLKTEILNDPEICLPSDLLETYTSKDGQVKKENYRELIERKAMPLEKYEQLFSIVRNASMPFIVSVYDFTAVDFATQHGACALKIASANIVHIPLIRYAAQKGLPLLIDTGRSTIAEVFNAVNTARVAGCEDIIIQHSPDGHPALPEAHNLRLLQTYSQAFNLPVGLSDHHNGLEMLYVSVALGASILEKGVHVYPEELDQDISHSMSLDDLPDVLQKVYDVWESLGSTERNPRQQIKGVIGSSQRQCVVAKRDIQPGETLTLDNVRFAFPCLGIPVQHWDLVNGSCFTSSVKADKPIQWSDIKRNDS